MSSGIFRFLILTITLTLTTNQVWGQGVPPWCHSNIQQTIILDDNSNTFFGSTLNEFIQGLAGADTLFGNAGDDCINGNLDNDVIFAGPGNDWVRGGAGNDNLKGNDGADHLYGDLGLDLMSGGNGDDYMEGGADNDTMYGNAGNDELHGEDGDDNLTGDDGHDRLYGDAGADKLYGRSGDDELHGGDGMDTLVGDQDDDRLYGERDNDTLNGGSGHDELQGGDGNDNLTGDDGDDRLYGDGGDDGLDGGPGSDQLHGGDGMDSLIGGDGNDQLNGDGGNDRLHGGTGHDQLRGGTGEDFMNGNEDNDTLYGGSENDDMHGGRHNDHLYGEAGNDRLYGNCEDDILEGGSGTDTYVYQRGGSFDTIIDSGSNTLLLENIYHEEYETQRVGNDLYLHFTTTMEPHGKIRIVNYYPSQSMSIQEHGGNGVSVAEIQQGGSVTLQAFGGPDSSFSWLHNGSNNASISVSPSQTTDYRVRITSLGRCEYEDIFRVVVLGCDVSISGSPGGAVTEGDAYSFTPQTSNCGPYSFSIVNQPAWAQFDSQTGRLYGTPNQSHVGVTQNIVISASGSNGSASLSSFSVEVLNRADPPVASDDNATTQEDQTVQIDVLSNDTDPDGDIVASSVVIVTAPGRGTASVSATGLITYEPALDSNGADSFVYRVCDSTGLCDTATVHLTVSPMPDPPVAVDDVGSTEEDTTVVLDVLANDTDPDQDLDPASLSLTVPPTHGQATITAGTVSYTPDLDYHGTDQFTYRVCDANGSCDTAVATLTIHPVNDLPVAVDDAVETDEDIAVLILATGNDTDVDGNLDPSTADVVSSPANGVLVNNGDGSFTFTPDTGFVGTSTFTYQVCDSDGACDTASVSIEVLAVNKAPTAMDDAAVTDEDTGVLVDVAANDDDPDGNLDPSTVSIISSSQDVLIVNHGDGTLTYTPAPNANGLDSLVYQICDSEGLCDTATLNVDIQPVDDPPLVDIVNQTLSVDEGASIFIDVDASDPDGGAVDIELLENGVVVAWGQTLEWKAPGVSGSTVVPLVVRVTDSSGNQTTVDLDLTVNDLYSSPLEVCASCTFTSLQDAICAAADGETVRVLEPILTEPNILVFGKHGVVIEGSGQNQTVVQASADPNALNSLITIETNYGRDNSSLIFRDLTFRHGQVQVRDGAQTNFENVTVSQTASVDGALVMEDSQVSITNSEISQNSGQFTGGARLISGSLEIRNSAIHNNLANDTEGANLSAGGILSLSGDLLLVNTTLSNNEGLTGGAVQLEMGSLLAANVTISGNQGGQAGGIYGDGTISLFHATIVNNSGSLAGGLVSSAPVQAVNTILADNPGGDCSGFILDAANLDSDGTCGAITGNAGVGVLANNGGPTFTHLIDPDGDARDQGDATLCSDPDFLTLTGGTDQRGNARTFGAACDLGAIELQAGEVSVSLPALTLAVAGSSSIEVADNALVDSYSSCNGIYGGANTGTNGNILSDGPITLSSGAMVTGTVSPNTTSGVTSFPVPDGLTSSGNLTVNTELELAGGDYLYDNITLQGGAILTTSGLARIWFRNRLDIQSNASAAGLDNKPSNLWLFAVAGNDPVSFQSNASLTGVLYAPDRRVDIQSNGDIYGALVGGQTTLMGNSRIHFDEALIGGPCSEPEPPVPGQLPVIMGAIDAAGDQATVMGNAVVDSYNASNGIYGGSNIGAMGHVLAAGSVNTQPNAQIAGQISAFSPSGAVSPAPPTGLASSGDFNVNGNVDLQAGDYLFHNINISSNANLKANGGLTRIWFTGSLIIQGGATIEGDNRNPSNVWFFDQAGNGQVILQSNSSLFGVVYTPNLPVTLHSNAQVFGAVVGYSVLLQDNGKIHRDEAL